jgi:hypothetical protein
MEEYFIRYLHVSFLRHIEENSFGELGEFLGDLLRKTKLPSKILTIALILLQRMHNACPFIKGSIGCCKRLSIASLILACKSTYDQPVNIKGWNRIFPQYSMEKLCKIETEFLACIRFDIVVSPEEFAFIQKLIFHPTTSGKRLKLDNCEQIAVPALANPTFTKKRKIFC